MRYKLQVASDRWQVKDEKITALGRDEFDFEKLNVYQRALSLADQLFSFCDRIPYRMQSSIGDQVRRAILSVCNNIAEGSDKKSRREKAMFYRYSLGSMRECIPALSLAVRRGVLSSENSSEFRGESLIICRMLRRLIESTDHD